MWKKIIFRNAWNPATCSCKNGKYLASRIDNSVITSDEIIEEKNSFNKL